MFGWLRDSLSRATSLKSSKAKPTAVVSPQNITQAHQELPATVFSTQFESIVEDVLLFPPHNEAVPEEAHTDNLKVPTKPRGALAAEEETPNTKSTAKVSPLGDQRTTIMPREGPWKTPLAADPPGTATIRPPSSNKRQRNDPPEDPPATNVKKIKSEEDNGVLKMRHDDDGNKMTPLVETEPPVALQRPPTGARVAATSEIQLGTRIYFEGRAGIVTRLRPTKVEVEYDDDDVVWEHLERLAQQIFFILPEESTKAQENDDEESTKDDESMRSEDASGSTPKTSNESPRAESTESKETKATESKEMILLKSRKASATAPKTSYPSNAKELELTLNEPTSKAEPNKGSGSKQRESKKSKVFTAKSKASAAEMNEAASEAQPNEGSVSKKRTSKKSNSFPTKWKGKEHKAKAKKNGESSSKEVKSESMKCEDLASKDDDKEDELSSEDAEASSSDESLSSSEDEPTPRRSLRPRQAKQEALVKSMTPPKALKSPPESTKATPKKMQSLNTVQDAVTSATKTGKSTARKTTHRRAKAGPRSAPVKDADILQSRRQLPQIPADDSVEENFAMTLAGMAQGWRSQRSKSPIYFDARQSHENEEVAKEEMHVESLDGKKAAESVKAASSATASPTPQASHAPAANNKKVSESMSNTEVKETGELDVAIKNLGPVQAAVSEETASFAASSAHETTTTGGASTLKLRLEGLSESKETEEKRRLASVQESSIASQLKKPESTSPAEDATVPGGSSTTDCIQTEPVQTIVVEKDNSVLLESSKPNTPSPTQGPAIPSPMAEGTNEQNQGHDEPNKTLFDTLKTPEVKEALLDSFSETTESIERQREASLSKTAAVPPQSKKAPQGRGSKPLPLTSRTTDKSLGRSTSRKANKTEHERLPEQRQQQRTHHSQPQPASMIQGAQSAAPYMSHAVAASLFVWNREVERSSRPGNTLELATGSRIAVWWNDRQVYLLGQVDAIDPKRNISPHHVVYDAFPYASDSGRNNNLGWMDLALQKFRIINENTLTMTSGGSAQVPENANGQGPRTSSFSSGLPSASRGSSSLSCPPTQAVGENVRQVAVVTESALASETLEAGTSDIASESLVEVAETQAIIEEKRAETYEGASPPSPHPESVQNSGDGETTSEIGRDANIEGRSRPADLSEIEPGSHIAVWLSNDRTFKVGVINRVDKRRKAQYHVVYNDKELSKRMEWLDLTSTGFRLMETKPEDAETLRMRVKFNNDVKRRSRHGSIKDVGRKVRIALYSAAERRYILGSIHDTRLFPQESPHLIRYDNGGEEWLHLRDYSFRVMDDGNQSGATESLAAHGAHTDDATVNSIASNEILLLKQHILSPQKETAETAVRDTGPALPLAKRRSSSISSHGASPDTEHRDCGVTDASGYLRGPSSDTNGRTELLDLPPHPHELNGRTPQQLMVLAHLDHTFDSDLMPAKLPEWAKPKKLYPNNDEDKSLDTACLQALAPHDATIDDDHEDPLDLSVTKNDIDGLVAECAGEAGSAKSDVEEETAQALLQHFREEGKTSAITWKADASIRADKLQVVKMKPRPETFHRQKDLPRQLLHPRPPGRPPRGKIWNEEIGEYIGGDGFHSMKGASEHASTCEPRRRPPGRAPKGMIWDAKLGEYVNEVKGSIQGPASLSVRKDLSGAAKGDNLTVGAAKAIGKTLSTLQSARQKQSFMQRPRGRPPRGKMWDANIGAYVDVNHSQNSVADSPVVGELEGEEGNSGSKYSFQARESLETPRTRVDLFPKPRGRPPKGRIWDARRGKYVKESEGIDTESVSDDDDTRRETTPKMLSCSRQLRCRAPKGTTWDPELCEYVKGTKDFDADDTDDEVDNGNLRSETTPSCARRPPGRAPKGKVWDTERGQYVMEKVDLDVDDNDVDVESQSSTDLVPKPRGHPPSGTVWDGHSGEWVSHISLPGASNICTDRAAALEEPELDVSRTRETTSDDERETKPAKRPAGRPPKGKIWNAEAGAYVDKLLPDEAARRTGKLDNDKSAISSLKEATGVETKESAVDVEPADRNVETVARVVITSGGERRVLPLQGTAQMKNDNTDVRKRLIAEFNGTKRARSLNRPKGRPPKGCVWSPDIGAYVDQRLPAAKNVAENDKDSSSSHGEPKLIELGSSSRQDNVAAAQTADLVPKPRGRPPAGKVWDGRTGAWVRPEYLKRKTKKRDSGNTIPRKNQEEGNAGGAQNQAAHADDSLRQTVSGTSPKCPAGRPPKGKVWNADTGQYMTPDTKSDDSKTPYRGVEAKSSAASSDATKSVQSSKRRPGRPSKGKTRGADTGESVDTDTPAAIVTKPRGRPPKGKVWDEHSGSWATPEKQNRGRLKIADIKRSAALEEESAVEGKNSPRCQSTDEQQRQQRILGDKSRSQALAAVSEDSRSRDEKAIKTAIRESSGPASEHTGSPTAPTPSRGPLKKRKERPPNFDNDGLIVGLKAFEIESKRQDVRGEGSARAPPFNLAADAEKPGFRIPKRKKTNPVETPGSLLSAVPAPLTLKQPVDAKRSAVKSPPPAKSVVAAKPSHGNPLCDSSHSSVNREPLTAEEATKNDAWRDVVLRARAVAAQAQASSESSSGLTIPGTSLMGYPNDVAAPPCQSRRKKIGRMTALPPPTEDALRLAQAQPRAPSQHVPAPSMPLTDTPLSTTVPVAALSPRMGESLSVSTTYTRMDIPPSFPAVTSEASIMEAASLCAKEAVLAAQTARCEEELNRKRSVEELGTKKPKRPRIPKRNLHEFIAAEGPTNRTIRLQPRCRRRPMPATVPQRPPRELSREENVEDYVTRVTECSILGGFVSSVKLDRPHGCAPEGTVWSDADYDWVPLLCDVTLLDFENKDKGKKDNEEKSKKKLPSE